MVKQDRQVIDPIRQIPAGAYVLRITDMYYVPEKDYFIAVYDVADGELKNFFKDIDYKSHCVYLTHDKKRRGWYDRTRQFNACVSEETPAVPYDCLENFNKNASHEQQLIPFINTVFGGYVVPTIYHSDYSNIDYPQNSVETYTTAALVRSGLFTMGRVNNA